MIVIASHSLPARLVVVQQRIAPAVPPAAAAPVVADPRDEQLELIASPAEARETKVVAPSEVKPSRTRRGR